MAKRKPTPARGAGAIPKDGVFDITPRRAAEWIAAYGATNFRKLNEGQVEILRRQMAANDWLLTNESVGFDWNGKLVDGQHRLNAIAQSKRKNVRVRVVTGLDPRVAVVIDSGAKRSAANVLFAQGVTYPSTVAAVVRAANSRDGQTRASGRLGNVEVADYAEDRPELVELCDRAHHEVYSKQPKGYRLLGPAPIATSVYFVYLKDGQAGADLLLEMLARVVTGIDLGAGSPEHALHRRLSLTAAGKSMAGGLRGSSNLATVAAILATFRLHVRGAVKVKRIVTGGGEQWWDMPYLDRKDTKRDVK